MMTSFHRLFCLLCMAVLITNCANSAGSSAGGTGTAALSLELELPGSEQRILTLNDFEIEITTFALAIEHWHLSAGDTEFESEDIITADFFDEEAPELSEIQDITVGEYDTVGLHLGVASGLTGDSVTLIKNLATGEEVSESLNDNSILVVASAVHDDGDACTLVFSLATAETFELEADSALTISAGEETEVLVAIDAATLFSGITVPDDCESDALVTITEADSLADTFIDSLSSAMSTETPEGHSHAH